MAAAALRAYHIGTPSLWLDEIGSVQSTMGHGLRSETLPADVMLADPPRLTDRALAAPWQGIVRNMTGPVGELHPPLGYVLLRGWCDVFGYSDASVRSLSAVASTLSVLLLFLIVRDLNGGSNESALWSAAIMAVAQTQIVFAQEARHYAPLECFALAAAWAIARIERRGPSLPRCIALALTVLAVLLTHYFGLGAVLALCLYALFRFRGRALWATLGALAVAAALFTVLWLPSLLMQLRENRGTVGYYLDADAGYLGRWAGRLAAVPFGTLAEPLPGSTLIAAGAAVLFVLPAVFARRRPSFLLWAIWIPSTVLVVAVSDWVNHTWLLSLPRHTLLAGPGVYATLAALPTFLPARRRLLRHAVPAAIVLGLAAFVPGAYAEFHRQDNRRVAERFKALASPGDVTVIFDARGGGFARARFLMTTYYAGQLPGSVLILSKALDPHDASSAYSQLAALDHFLVVCNMTCVPQNAIPGAIVLKSAAVPNAGCVYVATLHAPPTTSP